MLVSVASSDKYDDSTFSEECSQEQFRTIVASLCQVLHRTTAIEPLRKVQQTQGKRGFEAWRAIASGYDQRNMPGTNSGYAA